MSQDAKQPEKVYHLMACPSCGAAVSVDDAKCWLCQWDLGEDVVVAEVAAPARKRSFWSPDVIASVGSAIVLGGATLATLFVAPGIGVLLAIFFIIVLFALAKSLNSPAPRPYPVRNLEPDGGSRENAYAAPQAVLRTAPPRPADTTGKIVSQVLVAIGLALLIGIAAVIAFFTFCVICFVVLTSA